VFIFVHVFKKKIARLVVDLVGPPMCLCSGPGSDSGVNEGVGFPVCLPLASQFSLYYLFQTRHFCFASQILEARASYLQFRGTFPLRSLAQRTQPFVGPLASPETVFSRKELGDLTNLRFRDPGHFKAGMLHERFPVWQRLLARLLLCSGSSRDSPGWCSCGEFFHPI